MNLNTQFQGNKKQELLNEGKAVVEEGLIIYRYNSPATQKPVAMVWTEKSLKPIIHYVYPTEQAREEHIQKLKDGRKARQETLKKWADERKMRNQDVHVGDILHRSWGYSMVLNDFYQVVKESKGMLWVREIADRYTDSSSDGWQGYVVPIKDQFKGETVKAMKRSAAPSKWDGKPHFEDHND